MAEESNFDSLKAVRITYGELLELAAKLRLECCEKTTSNSDESAVEVDKTDNWGSSDADANISPTASIAHDDDVTSSSAHPEFESSAGKFGTDSNDGDDRKNRNRRPDQRLYVPRHRANSLRLLPQNQDEDTKSQCGCEELESRNSKRYSNRRGPRRTRTVSNSTDVVPCPAKDPEFRNGDFPKGRSSTRKGGTRVSTSDDHQTTRRRFCSGDSYLPTGEVLSHPTKGTGDQRAVGPKKATNRDKPSKADADENNHTRSRDKRERGVKGRRKDRGGGDGVKKDCEPRREGPKEPIVSAGTYDDERKDQGDGSKDNREGRWDSWELSEDNQDEDVLGERKTRVFVSSVIDWSEEVERELGERSKETAVSVPVAEDLARRERSPARNRKKRSGKQRRKPSPRASKDPRRKDDRVGDKDGENRGILHLPSPVQSDKKPLQANERDFVQKHLFNPDNPDKPLIVSQPTAAHHVTQQRRAAREMQGYVSPYHQHQVPEDVSNASPKDYSTRAFGYPACPQIEQQVIEGPYKIGPSARIAVVEKNIREAMFQEEELTAHLSQSFDRMDLKRMSQIRWKIQVRYENCILADLEFCSKHNIEQTLWKAAFYQVIEAFRRQMIEVPSYKEEVRAALLGLIDEGVVFYENLLEKLQDTFGFLLAHFLDSDALRPHSSRSEKLAILSSQKVLICLGDLARYQEQANETCHYGKARNWYLKAQQLAPKNGRPYNQLAILALYARRKMDAVYYYMRSLAASNPFVTAKESLIALFDETRKKYEMEERMRSSTRPMKVSPPTRAPPTSLRVELWYTPDGHISKPSCWPEELERDPMVDNLYDSDSAETGEGDLAKFTPVELNKKFVLSFLHVHGKLFSRVGMETFADICVQMLKEFRALLQQGPSSFNGHKLLQVITINMYAVHNTEQKGHPDVDQYECRSLLQTRAVEMSMEMFSLLLGRCNMLLNKSEEPLNEELRQHLLPAVKVWCDWLLSDPVVWNPLPSLVDLDISGGKEDCWSRLASFINRIKSLKRQINCQLITEKKDGCEPVVLPEDTTLAGFVPLLHMPQVPVFAVAPIDKEKTRLLLRLHRIEYTAEVLCGLDPPVLVFDVGRLCYTAAVASPQDDHQVEDRTLPNAILDEDLEDVDEDAGSWGDLTNDLDSAAEEDQGSDGGGVNIRRDLRSRKLHLEKVKANQERHQRQIQAVLQEVSQTRRVRFEVHPKFLVPDTNCFIDHLPDMRALVKSAQYQLVVPLIVINELDGLARGMKPSPRPLDAAQGGVVVPESSYSNERAHRVAQVAKEALKFLEDCFLKKLSYVRAVTIKGTFLSSITFRSESVGDYKGSNDDIVLNCCLQLSKIASEDSKIDKGEFTVVWREVVLLTDDRNLRIKAHSHEVPTRGVPRFLKLMRIG